jgi:hypothetical protein
VYSAPAAGVVTTGFAGGVVSIVKERVVVPSESEATSA